MENVTAETGVQTPNVGQFVVTWNVELGEFHIHFTAPIAATTGQFIDLLDQIKRKAMETDGFRS